MDKIKRIIMCHLETSICNFRCPYCYLTHRGESYKGRQTIFQYPPEYVGRAFSVERLGGLCFVNFCAEGETLLTKNIDAYIKAIVEQGHYAEIVTNMVITPIIDKILAWDASLLERVEFKCSFHYLELLKNGLLDTFAENVNKAWKSGASASVEITPSDELIPYIDEVKSFSLKHFGAYPQLTIARNDGTRIIDYLTDLSPEEYKKTWEQFDSPFWRFKCSIFKEKRHEYCYAGMYALFVNLADGYTRQCYKSLYHQNILKNINKPIRFIPIGKCMLPHCYNGHALLTMGCIPNKFNEVKFGRDIRNRIRLDGRSWLNEKVLKFFNTRADEDDYKIGLLKKIKFGILNAAGPIFWDYVWIAKKAKRSLLKKRRFTG